MTDQDTIKAVTKALTGEEFCVGQRVRISNPTLSLLGEEGAVTAVHLARWVSVLIDGETVPRTFMCTSISPVL